MTPEDMKRRRAVLRWTQARLAEAMGVTWNTVARWETGQRRIPEMAIKLLAYLERDRDLRRRTVKR